MLENQSPFPHGAFILVEETDSKLVNNNVILGGKGFKEEQSMVRSK